MPWRRGLPTVAQPHLRETIQSLILAIGTRVVVLHGEALEFRKVGKERAVVVPLEPIYLMVDSMVNLLGIDRGGEFLVFPPAARPERLQARQVDGEVDRTATKSSDVLQLEVAKSLDEVDVS